MEEMGNLPDPAAVADMGFVVEWQLTPDIPALIDLSDGDAVVVLPDDVAVESDPRLAR